MASTVVKGRSFLAAEESRIGVDVADTHPTTNYFNALAVTHDATDAAALDTSSDGVPRKRYIFILSMRLINIQYRLF